MTSPYCPEYAPFFGFLGAALALEGRWLFEPVSDPRARRNVHGDDARDKE